MNCRYCNVPYQGVTRFCDRCGAPTEGLTLQPPRPDWITFTDAWEGLTLQHPPGWSVLQPASGLIEVLGPNGERAEFESGRIEGGDVKEVGERWSSRLRAVRANLRIRQSLDGAQLRFEDASGEGEAFVTTVGQRFQIVSAWAPNLTAHREILGAVLGSFRKIEPLPRRVWLEPNEHAIGILLPESWQASGGLKRDWCDNLSQEWSCHPQGSERVALRCNYHDEVFREPAPKGILGKLKHATYAANQIMTDNRYLSRAIPLVFGSGQEITERHYAPLWRQKFPDLRVLEYRHVPTAEKGQEELLAGELANTLGGSIIASVYDVHVEFTEAGIKMHRRSRIATRRVAPSPYWFGAVCFEAQAPVSEWAHWEPILLGIQESWRIEPSWMERQKAAHASVNYTNVIQQDMAQRYADISRTLSETGDIITSGYWNRQPVSTPAPTYDWSHNWSQMMRGRDDRTDDSGNRYDVPGGYDRYWVDTNNTTVFAGDWKVTPDPSWRELR